MKSFSLPTIWFKTVQGTDLENYNWDEIVSVLSDRNIIVVVAPLEGKKLPRYILRHSAFDCAKTNIRDAILEVLRIELPKRFGERRVQ